MTRLSLTGLLIAGALCSAAPAAQEKYLHTDSIGSPVTETSHVFHCELNRLQISFVERVRLEDHLDLVDRWRIVLTGLNVSGRNVPPADMRALEARFHDFAWIERVKAACTRFNKELYVSVFGMRADEWANVGKEKERPKPRMMSFTIRDDGTVRLH